MRCAHVIILPERSGEKFSTIWVLGRGISFRFIGRLFSRNYESLFQAIPFKIREWIHICFSFFPLYINYPYETHPFVLWIARPGNYEVNATFGRPNTAARWKHVEVDTSGEAYNGIPTVHRVDRHRTCMRGASTSSKRHCGTAVYFLSLKRDKRIMWNKEKRETYRPFCKYRYNCTAERAGERSPPPRLRGLT